MKKLTGYMAGVNLGGWLSQYEGNLARDPEHHFTRFITREDIARIASWCKEYGLNMVLDLHMAPGFSFGTPVKNTLFSDDFMQERFMAIWQAFARRYNGEGRNIVYELLNEIVEPDSTRWNRLADRTIRAIREVDSNHAIIVGGIDYNNVWRLADMPIFDDPDIIYNFHMYEPFALTHQRTPWTAARDYPGSVVYPDAIAPYNAFIDYILANGGRESYDLQKEICSGLDKMDSAYIQAFLQPAKDFIARYDLPLYCGEYGVIVLSDLASRAAWTRDVAEFCLANGIGRAVWTYKGMDFSLIDDRGQPLSGDLVRAAALH